MKHSRRILNCLALVSAVVLAVAARAADPVPVPVPAPEPLAWDAISKEFIAKPGDTNANFTFSVTNVSATEVVINNVRPSCGCTVASLPSKPWR